MKSLYGARNKPCYVIMAGVLMVLLVAHRNLQAQTTVDLKTQSKNVDFSAATTTKPSKIGTVLPATCTAGEQFFKSDASPGRNLYGCTATNIWTLMSGVSQLPSITQAGAVLGVDSSASAYELKTVAPGVLSLAGTIGLDTAVVPFYYTGTAAPSASCTAGRDFYTDTTAQELWMCTASNTWKRVLSIAGSYRVTGVAGTAPATPASGSVVQYFDSTAKTAQTVDDTGAKATMVRPESGSSHYFLTSISSAGVPGKAQPAFSDLSGTATASQLPLFAASGASHAAGMVPDPGATAGTTKFLREDASWMQPSFAGLSGSASVTQLPVMTGSGASHAAGIVPDPGATAGTTRFLREDATFAVPATASPGGSSGQIQYNASGSFGGLSTSGNGTTVATTSGSLTSGNCIKADASGNLVDAGAACGTGSGSASASTHNYTLRCDVPRTQSLAGNAFWTVTALTNFDFGHWEFLPAVDSHIYCSVTVPHVLGSTPAAKIILETSSANTASSKAVRWQVSTKNVANSGSYDVTFTAETAQNITQSTTANTRTDVTFTLTNQPSADDELIVDIARIGSNAADTMTTLNAQMFKAFLQISSQ